MALTASQNITTSKCPVSTDGLFILVTSQNVTAPKHDIRRSL